MSKPTRIPVVNDSRNEAKGQVELTIGRPKSATGSTGSSASNKAGSRSIKILGRIEEQEGYRADTRRTERSDKNIGCRSKFDVTSPESLCGNRQRRESSNQNSRLFENRETSESKLDSINDHLGSPNARSDCKAGLESVSENSCEQRRGPLVELQALHKLLDKLRPNDHESTSAWHSSESCCREIVLRFQKLLSEWASDRKRVDDWLFMDDTLSKCQHCGVIKCADTPRHQENVLERKTNEGIMTAEREIVSRSKIRASPVVKSSGRTEIMRNSYPAVPPRCRSDKTTLHEKSVSNPVTKKSSIKRPNANKIIDQTCENNAARDKRVIKADDSSDLQREASKNAGKEKSHPLMETVKYLARGNFAAVKNVKSQDSLRGTSANDVEPSYYGKPLKQKNRSFALHGSRDMDFHHDPRFFLCDRLRLHEEEMRSELDTKENDIESKTCTLDLSEDAASLSERNDVRLKESGTSTFSSSSAENMIRRWIKPSRNVPEANIDSFGADPHEALAVGPSSPNVQTIRARITDAIEKFANRSDDYIYGQSNLSCRKNPSDDISSMKPTRNINTSGYCIENRIGLCSSSALSVVSSRNFEHQRLSVETSERFERQILYDEVSSRDSVSQDSITAAGSKVLLMYRKILESNEEMDWESFEKLVSALHPSQRELWCDICKAVSNEAKRVADETGATTEVSIEINPLPCKFSDPTVRSNGDEITFELDMIVNDVDAPPGWNDHLAIIKRANKEKK